MTTETNLEKTNTDLTMSARFTNKVLAEFSGSTGELQITDFQRSLIQNYFIGIDRALKMGEQDRLRRNENNKDHKFDNPIPMTWSNVNLNDLALDVVHYARLGLDMMQPNMISPIPYRNKKTNLYDITLMPGYNGIRYVAENYALIRPKSVTVDLVYSNDRFKPIKKSVSHPIETYEFEIENAFDRGDILGGFGYIEYDDPSKNELVVMSLRDILKRKPKYASANFWGGKSVEWENGSKVETEKEGWFEEMCRKTIIREVYSAKHIPRDPRKIDESYQYMKRQEQQMRQAQDEIRQEINVTANSVPIEAAISAGDAPVMIPKSTETHTEVQAETLRPTHDEIPERPLRAAQPPESSPLFDDGPNF